MFVAHRLHPPEREEAGCQQSEQEQDAENLNGARAAAVLPREPACALPGEFHLQQLERLRRVQVAGQRGGGFGRNRVRRFDGLHGNV